MTSPIKYPIMMMVDEMVSSGVQLRINKEIDSRKKIPHINAILDKNKSHFINYKFINYL
jgi:hypothetical protein